MITIRSIYFFIVVGIFFLSILGIAANFYFRYRRREKYPYGEWNSLLRRLGTLDHDSLALIARDSVVQNSVLQDYVVRDSVVQDEEPLDPTLVWELLGGTQGLDALEKNCAVLVDLAFYVQQWYPEALLVAEELRLNAREVQWHIDRLRGAAKTGKLKMATPDYLQQAVAIYYRMTCLVLSLYEQAHLPGLTDLQRAL
jgi:hypothetical protein